MDCKKCTSHNSCVDICEDVEKMISVPPQLKKADKEELLAYSLFALATAGLSLRDITLLFSMAANKKKTWFQRRVKKAQIEGRYLVNYYLRPAGFYPEIRTVNINQLFDIPYMDKRFEEIESSATI